MELRKKVKKKSLKKKEWPEQEEGLKSEARGKSVEGETGTVEEVQEKKETP